MNSIIKIPKDGIAGLFEHGRADMIAGFWVFLTTLPLSFAIAWGSSFPLYSCIITTIVGGVFVAFISGSPIIIKSSSISLVAMIGLAVQEMSPYQETGIKYVLAILILSGVIQVILGILRISNWYGVVSDAVVYGLVSAVSLWVLVKQLHFLTGLVPQSTNFFNLLIEFILNCTQIDFSVALMGVICLMILQFPTWMSWTENNTIPSILVVLVVAMLGGYYFGFESSETKQSFAISPDSLKEIFVFPDFSKIYTFESFNFAFAIAILVIFDSLVNIKSLEVLDFYRRKSKKNRELIALGLGNIICGFLGAFPMSSTMTNSNININRGASTRWAGFFQAIFLIVIILIGFNFFKYIPKVALSAILIAYTYKLNSPKLIQSIYEVGIDQLIIFLFTFIFTLIFGIIAGFIGGIFCNFVVFTILGSPFYSLFRAKVELSRKGKHKTKLNIYGAALGSNYLSIKKYLNKIETNDRVILDLSKAKVVDHNFLEQIYYFAYLNEMNDGKIELQGLKLHFPVSKHPLATLRIISKSKSQNMNIIQSLDERQLDIRGVAAVNNATFEPNLTYDGVVLNGFSFTIGYEIRYRENKFLKFYHTNTLEFSDVFLSKGLRMSDLSHKLSVMLVSLIEVEMPDFVLSKENLISKVWNRLGYNDINFESYPNFSNIYRLTGENEKAIRSFFHADLLKFLEENQEYTLEAKSNRLLIYKSKNLMNKTELEDCIHFAENFIDICKLHFQD